MFILAFTCDREAKSMPPTHVAGSRKKPFVPLCTYVCVKLVYWNRFVSACQCTPIHNYQPLLHAILLRAARHPPLPPPRCASRSNSSAICFLSPVLLRSIYPSIRVRERARSADEFNGSGNFQIFRPRAIRLSLLDIRLPLFTQKSNIVLSSCRETWHSVLSILNPRFGSVRFGSLVISS